MSLYELHEQPELHDPVLVMFLEGWIDAGLGSVTALAGLMSAVETRVIASFDTDVLLDYRARRPIVRIVDGVNTGLTWPDLELRAGHDLAGRAVLVLAGPEPDHRWRAFCTEVVELARQLGVRRVVGLGAFPAPVPHTRPCRLVATATSQGLAERMGFLTGGLDVPAGAQAALEHSFGEAGIPAVTLWARVPHYVAAMPYPEASAALLEGLGELVGIDVGTAALREAARETRGRLDELIANNPDHARLVAELEAQQNTQAEGGLGNLPTGEEIAAELERFLRDEP